MSARHRCRGCRHLKPVADFQARSGSPRSAYCATCRTERRRPTGGKGGGGQTDTLNTEMFRRCAACERELPIDRYRSNRSSGAPRSTCRTCNKRRGKRLAGVRPIDEYRAELEQRATARLESERERRQLHPREQLRRLLIALLRQRCEEEGVGFKAVRYAARWNADATFRERERRRQQEYKHANPEAVARWGERRKTLAASQSDGTLTRAAIGQLFARAHLCPYCGVDMERSDMTLDHRVPLSRGGVHGASNVVVCCRRCNHEKRDLPYDAWLAVVSRRAGCTVSDCFASTYGSLYAPATEGDAQARGSSIFQSGPDLKMSCQAEGCGSSC